MKAIIKKTDIDKIVKVCAAAHGGRGIRPILSNVLIEVTADGVSFFTHGNGSYRSVSLEVIGAPSCGAITCSASMLASFLEVVSGDVELSLGQKETLLIKSGGTSAELNTIPATEFPVLQDGAKEDLFLIAADYLASELRRVVTVCEQTILKPAYKSVCFEVDADSLCLVATDAKRVAVGELKIDSKKKIELLVPGDSCKLIMKMDQDSLLTFRKSGGYLEVTNGIEVVGTNLVDDAFPNWRLIVPKEIRGVVKLERKEIVSGLKIIAPIAKEEEYIARLRLLDQEIEMSCVSARSGGVVTTVSAETSGDLPEEMGFNSSFLEKMLSMMGEKIEVSISKANQPALVTHNESKFRYILMPIILEE
jgi:DNA polymerase-3 subunit beta